MDVTQLRLLNQRLTGKKFIKPDEVVGWLGAVQAQDYPAAKWSLGLRLKHATDFSIEQAFNKGAILRTHIMRPTWHFVLPQDIRWMTELTAPRVKTLLAHYNRKLELDDALFKKSNAVLIKFLQKKHLTRKELKSTLEDVGIKTDVQRLAHIIMWAELDALICSGPRIGKQFTYALLENRVPKTKKLNHDESLAKLSMKYFLSHGPAQLKDFSWWSGLTVKDSVKGLDFIKSKLINENVNGKTYWFAKNSPKIEKQNIQVFLLSIYDEYTISYKDRSDLSEKREIEKMISMGNALTAVVIINSKVAGTWKRISSKNKVAIKLSLFRKLDKSEQEALQSEAIRYGKFLGVTAVIEI